MTNQPEMKFFEIRDRGTCMPAMGIKMTFERKNPNEAFLLSSAGYGLGHPLIMLVFIEINICNYNPFAWGDRTKQAAHRYIEENFDDLESGQVVDVRFILGETKSPERSDIFSHLEEFIKELQEKGDVS